MAQKKFKKGSFGWFSGAGALHLLTDPITLPHKGEMITASTAQFLHPGSRRNAKDTEDVLIKTIREIPTKEKFNSVIEICSQPQDPVSIESLDETVNQLLQAGELEDLAKIVSYCRGRGKEFKVYHGHAILALATIPLARRLEERKQAVPPFDSQKWDDLFSSAIGHIEKNIPDKIITPTLEEIELENFQTAEAERLVEENKLQQESFEELLPDLMKEVGEYVQQRADIEEVKENKRGTKAGKIKKSWKEKGWGIRRSLQDVETPKLLGEALSTSFDALDRQVNEQIAFEKWQTAQEKNPLIQYDKNYQVELLQEWAAIKWGSGRTEEQVEIVTLFERDKLTFREANLVMSMPFKKRVTEDAVDQALRSENAAYIYDDEPLTEDNVRKSAFEAASKAINALENTTSETAQKARQYLVEWKRPREAEFAPQ